MDSSKLCANIQAGESGKTAALVSNLLPNISNPGPVGKSRENQVRTQKENPNTAHHLLACLIRTMHHIIL